MLLCFTASHLTTGFDTLEKLERSSEAVTSLLTERHDIAGSIVLATCNRFEAYLDVPAAAAASDTIDPAVLDLIGTAVGMSADAVRALGRIVRGREVVEHLLSVASGLESVVVGEGEIAGQVRRAVESARSRGTVSRELERVFQLASRTSRGVKNRTGLSNAGRSVVRLALDMAETRITDWAQTHVLLLGTGRYAGASLAALRERGVRHVLVYSRSGRAESFAASHGITAVQADELTDAVAGSDVIVACSVAPTVILDAKTLMQARERSGALLRRLIVDMGLPRNVDPQVAGVPETELLDLETIRAHAPLPELGATDDARALVERAVADYHTATAEDAVTPALVALRRHVFEVLDGEIEWARRRGDTSAETESALRHLAGVLLHSPSVRARELARRGRADEFTDAVGTLFGLDARPSCPHLADKTDTDDDEAAS